MTRRVRHAPRKVWLVLHNDAGTVLAVYGDALLPVAQDRQAAIHGETGAAVHLVRVLRARPPHVGDLLSLESRVGNVPS